MELPRMIPIEQIFDKMQVGDIPDTIRRQFAQQKVKAKIGPGMKVAIAVGSRGIANLRQVVVSVVSEVKRLEASPFIVPAMGSHGGATAEGQEQLLAGYGIIEQLVGAPIVASMETIQIGCTSDGTPLYFDKHAYEADAVIVVNRIKPHTDFKGPVESGLLKMMVIGLGKHKGAAALHSRGFDRFPELIPEASRIVIACTPLALGVAIIENAYDEIARIQVLPAEEVPELEPVLLEEAKSLMPRLCVNEIDVLLIDEIGKEISGSGMDPNITGRMGLPFNPQPQAPPIQKIVVRDLTELSHGNATGIGLADITTRRLLDKIDFPAMYTNCMTSTVLAGAKIPVVLCSDREAIEAAIKTCNRIRPERVKLFWIKNTLQLRYAYISEVYIEEKGIYSNVKILGDPIQIPFDNEGNIRASVLFAHGT